MIKEILERCFGLYDDVNAKGGIIGQVTLVAEGLTLEEVKETIEWLLARGAEWMDDKEGYEGMSYPETYHLWLGIPSIKICCGFSFNGESDKKMQYAIDKRKTILCKTEN
jgi:hypothetical protein